MAAWNLVPTSSIPIGETPEFEEETIEQKETVLPVSEFIVHPEYSLDQIVEAYKYVESGQKTGNVILNVANSNEYK